MNWLYWIRWALLAASLVMSVWSMVIGHQVRRIRSEMAAKKR